MNGFKGALVSAFLLTAVGLTGCGRHRHVNPPTEPAQAIDAPDVAPAATGSSGGRVAGTGPTSFVGRWAADVAWCASHAGEHSPIKITPVRFEAYDKTCHIYSVDETATGYLAVLQCQGAQGANHQERVHLSVADHVLTLSYPDNGGAQVRLRQCTTLADVAPPTTPTAP